MLNFIRKLLYGWILSGFVFLLIGFLSVFKYKPPALLFTTSDYIKHFIAYLFLSILMFFPFEKNYSHLRVVVRSAIIFVFCVVYGILLEFAQNYVPGRDPDIFDAYANSLGALTGQIIIILVSLFKTDTAETSTD